MAQPCAAIRCLRIAARSASRSCTTREMRSGVENREYFDVCVSLMNEQDFFGYYYDCTHARSTTESAVVAHILWVGGGGYGTDAMIVASRVKTQFLSAVVHT